MSSRIDHELETSFDDGLVPLVQMLRSSGERHFSRRDFFKSAVKAAEVAGAITLAYSIPQVISGEAWAASSGWKWTPAQEKFYSRYLLLIEKGIDPETNKMAPLLFKYEKGGGRVFVLLPEMSKNPVIPTDPKRDLPLDKFVRLRNICVSADIENAAVKQKYLINFFYACDARARKELPRIIDQMQRNLDITPSTWHPTPGYTLCAFCKPSSELIRYFHLLFSEQGGQTAITVDRNTPPDKLEKAKLQYERDVLEFTNHFTSAVIQETHEIFRKDPRSLFVKCVMQDVAPLGRLIGDAARQHYTEYVVRGKDQLHLNPKIERNRFSLTNFGLVVQECAANGKFHDRTGEFEESIEMAAQRVFKRVIEPLKDWRVIEGGGAEHFENGQWVKVPELAGPQFRKDVQPVRESAQRLREGKQPLYKSLVSSYYFRHYLDQPSSGRQPQGSSSEKDG